MSSVVDFLYFYIAIYSVLFLIMALKNLNKKKFNIQKRYSNLGTPNELCLIIYSHNNGKNLESIIKQLKEQTYPQESFKVYAILDNCSDGSEKLFQNDTMVSAFNITGQGTVGKDQAISILLEKLSEVEEHDAYIFLDANRFIEKDFLTSINAALQDSPVISGSTVLVGENLNLRQKIKKAFHKYYTNFIQTSRSLLGLAMIIDSDIFVIKQSLMKKIGCVDFKNINAELKYSLLLSKIRCRCEFNPNIKTYINIDDFSLRIPSLSARLGLFKDCFGQSFTNNIVFIEQTFSLLTPNILLLILSYAIILWYSSGYYFIVDFSTVLITLTILAIGFVISLINTNMKAREVMYLLLYPVYSLFHVIKNFPIIRFIRKKISGKDEQPTDTQKFIVDVEVTDGKKAIPCKLELISESGLAKAKFIFKKKKFITKTHLRMVDAITEIINKLSDYGFVLKICQCCSNFTQNIDGSTNMIKGFCNFQFTVSQEGEIPTLLWNSCKGFNQQPINNIIQEILNE